MPTFSDRPILSDFSADEADGRVIHLVDYLRNGRRRRRRRRRWGGRLFRDFCSVGFRLGRSLGRKFVGLSLRSLLPLVVPLLGLNLGLRRRRLGETGRKIGQRGRSCSFSGEHSPKRCSS